MIFIIGGNGFVGSAFVRYCERHGLEHRVITRENYEQFAGASCTLLVNANGNSSKLLSNREPLRDFDASVRTVRASLADITTDVYVLLSSCDVYPDCSTPETTREDRVVNPADQSGYGFHKALAERCVQHAAKNWLIFRLGGMVGPRLRKNAIYDILQGGPLWLAPESELQFMATDDVAGTVFRIADSGTRNDTFNLCGNGTVRLSTVMGWVDGSVEVKPDAPAVRYNVSIEKISKLTPIPRTDEAIRRFVEQARGA